MARQAVVQADMPEESRERDAALRPRWLREVIGQRAVVQRLAITLNACKKLKEPLGHILFDGPPGLRPSRRWRPGPPPHHGAVSPPRHRPEFP